MHLCKVFIHMLGRWQIRMLGQGVDECIHPLCLGMSPPGASDRSIRDESCETEQNRIVVQQHTRRLDVGQQCIGRYLLKDSGSAHRH